MPDRKQLTRLLVGSVVVALGLTGAALLLMVSTKVLNDDLYARLTQTTSVPSDLEPPTSTGPTARVVIHRILPDENAVELSVVLSIDSDDPLAIAIKRKQAALVAEVHDGQAVEHFALVHRSRLDDRNAVAGMAALAAPSDRFLLPALPSLSGYPFDDLLIRPMIIVKEETGSWIRFHTEVEKTVPGRLLKAKEVGGAPEITLTRSTTEKVFVTSGAALFILISLVVAIVLFKTPLTGIGDLVAVAGYLLATAGVRDLLGISRAAGIGSLEVLVVGLPLLFLALALGASTLAGQRKTEGTPPTPLGVSPNPGASSGRLTPHA